MNVRLSELDREIQQLEQRIADDRVQLMSALGDCRHSVRETVSSPKSLLTVAAVGFIAGRLLLPGKAKAETKQTQRQSRAGSVLGLLTAGLSLVQPGYGAGGLVRWAAQQLWEHRKRKQPAERETGTVRQVRMPAREKAAAGAGR